MIMIGHSSWILALLAMYLAVCSSALAQMRDDDINLESEQYHESALRRFEIVFTISIPFTTIHSYLAVRGVEMVRQGKISPKLSGVHWKSIGGLAVLFSGFVATWDYLHTRGEDIQNRDMPRDHLDLSMVMPGGEYQVLAREPTLRLLSARF
jgi:hypothetical protein